MATRKPSKTTANKKRRTPVVWSEKDKTRVVALVEKWRGLLLLNGHHINVKFSDTARVDDEGNENLGACAEMASNFPYMSGHLMTVFPCYLNEPDEEEAERKIIHELMHIITYPQRALVRRMFRDYFVTADEAKNACETATDWLANIVWAMYDSKGKR